MVEDSGKTVGLEHGGLEQQPPEGWRKVKDTWKLFGKLRDFGQKNCDFSALHGIFDGDISMGKWDN